MPKMKSHTGMGKRVRVTGNGKIVSAQSGKRHHMEVKSSRHARRITGLVVLTKADTKRIKRLLGR
ncbi:50S ribosomal protein L35 [Virgisporangium aliadipatigenens]|uniref:Large ribosomal subunit protein bL35 n=1 Tax=Virgisporangium aliadipatigenens TaxID=741659 RepID=A0A8J3YXS4_9ACTN|nr:50S ribosomal protein L35 [Virgisporangium aliadipatigenens]GIJ51548.1 50S ribosomal protein L35 [Virgisporangium aliadipatigenens]